MSRQRALKPLPAPPQQTHSHPHRAYTVLQVCGLLAMPRSTFYQLSAAGQLPFLEELRPRLGHSIRFRADLVDRYLAGEWNQPRAFRSHVTHRAAPAAGVQRKSLAAEESC